MKHRYFAVLTAALVLVGASACGSKPSTLNPPDTTPFTDAASESATETEPTDESASASETTESTSEGETESTASSSAAPAASATAPAKLDGSAPQPATLQPTVDPKKLESHPDSADDDQMGELRVDVTELPATSAHPDKPAATVPATKATEKPAEKPAGQTSLATKGGNASGKLQVIVDTAEVTVDQLKANNYTVDLQVRLDKNPGIIYSMWGLKLDSRCTYEADTDDLPIAPEFSINEQNAFLWTAWTNGAKSSTKTCPILNLHVKLPADAKAGTTYPITYADMSLQPAAHIWQGEEKNWAGDNEVGWTNGGVIVK